MSLILKGQTMEFWYPVLFFLLPFVSWMKKKEPFYFGGCWFASSEAHGKDQRCDFMPDLVSYSYFNFDKSPLSDWYQSLGWKFNYFLWRRLLVLRIWHEVANDTMESRIPCLAGRSKKKQETEVVWVVSLYLKQGKGKMKRKDNLLC